jgi:diguanylate cyclase (GGDEF)-like protein
MTLNSGESQQFLKFKRRSFLIGLPLGATAALVSFVAERTIYPGDLASPLFFLLLAGWLGLLTLMVGVMKHISKSFEYLVFVSLNIFFLFKLALPLLLPTETVDAASGVTIFGYWYPVLYALAFVMFGLRKGIRLSLLFYSITLAVVATVLVQHLLDGDLAEHYEHFYALSQLVFSGGILILLFATSAKLTRLHAKTAYSMQYLANTDSLTKVNSRRHIEALLEEELSRAKRYGRPLSVVLVDVDHFKGVNDRYGHDMGDNVLHQFATILNNGVRRVDHVGRWGGEEFILVLPEIGATEAQLLASRLRQNIEEHPFGQVGKLTASFGVASVKPQDTVATLVKRSDLVLYQAKAEGRNKVVATHF